MSNRLNEMRQNISDLRDDLADQLRPRQQLEVPLQRRAVRPVVVDDYGEEPLSAGQQLLRRLAGQHPAGAGSTTRARRVTRTVRLEDGRTFIEESYTETETTHYEW